MTRDDYPDVPITLAVALTLWAGAVAAGTQAGIFLKLPAGAFAALVAFAIAFAAGVVLLDARVRGWLDGRGAQSAWLALLGIAGILVASGVGLAASPPASGGIAAAPWAPLLVFVVPVTLALLLAVAGAVWRGSAAGIRPPASTAPVRRRAATSGSRTSVASAGAARARAAG